MMGDVKRWLSVAGAVAALWALPAAAEGTPVDCGSVDCEGIQEMKALYTAEVSYFQERDRYSLVLADVGFEPATCGNEARARTLGPGWTVGCNFAYRVTCHPSQSGDSTSRTPMLSSRTHSHSRLSHPK